MRYINLRLTYLLTYLLRAYFVPTYIVVSCFITCVKAEVMRSVAFVCHTVYSVYTMLLQGASDLH